MITPTGTAAGTPARVRGRGIDNPVSYRFVIAGHLDDHWFDWLGDVTLVHNDDATTTLTLTVADQAQLQGVLVRIRDIGASLLALQQVEEPEGPQAATPALTHRRSSAG